MKRSDIEEYKAIAYTLVCVLCADWIVLSCVMGVLAIISFASSCIAAYHKM